MRLSLLTVTVLLATATSAHAASGPEIHAHRGGSVLDGVPTFAEETMPAFRHALLREGAVLELDVKLTRDRVPVVIHDETLDRTTDCTGDVADKTLAEFLACRADVLGSGATTTRVDPFVALPALSEVLAFARDEGATLNLEIKNIPGQSDFDPTSAYTDTVIDAVLASGFPLGRLIVQSFWPANLDAARVKVPGVALSLLTLQPGNQGGIDLAASRRYPIVSPGWPVDDAYVRRARTAGLKIVPYTLNDAKQVQEAARLGVDAVITDDPVMARRALGRPEPGVPAPPTPSGAAPSVGTPRRGAYALLGRVARRLATVRRRGRLAVRLTVSEPATVTLVARRGRRVVARRTVRRPAGQADIGLAVRRRALAGRSASLRVAATVRTRSGAVIPLRLAVRLR